MGMFVEVRVAKVVAAVAKVALAAEAMVALAMEAMVAHVVEAKVAIEVVAAVVAEVAVKETIRSEVVEVAVVAYMRGWATRTE